MVTVPVFELDESLSVMVTGASSNTVAYTVVHEGEEVARYETSADPRTIGGRIGLRNVVCRHVPDADKEAVEERLTTAFADREDELADELGPR